MTLNGSEGLAGFQRGEGGGLVLDGCFCEFRVYQKVLITSVHLSLSSVPSFDFSEHKDGIAFLRMSSFHLSHMIHQKSVTSPSAVV